MSEIRKGRKGKGTLCNGKTGRNQKKFVTTKSRCGAASDVRGSNQMQLNLGARGKIPTKFKLRNLTEEDRNEVFLTMSRARKVDKTGRGKGVGRKLGAGEEKKGGAEDQVVVSTKK